MRSGDGRPLEAADSQGAARPATPADRGTGAGSRPAPGDLDALARAVFARRSDLPFVLRGVAPAGRFAEETLATLFPQRAGRGCRSAAQVAGRLENLLGRLERWLDPIGRRLPRPAAAIVRDVADALPGVYDALWLDARAIDAGDPASTGVDEVIAAYPGFLAIAVYRIAHLFSLAGVPVFPRLLTEYAHQRTAIDIHPGARIGRSFCIDHGTGVVIGETTVIGDQVKIYQGVTLGALSVDKSLSSTKRHPTIEDRVVVYANATILGGLTRVGHDSVIGGNVWLTASVAPYSTVYHANKVRVRGPEVPQDLPGERPAGGAQA